MVKMLQKNKATPNELADEFTNYNQYILNILTQIQDFDVWYEQFYKKEFPKEWYGMINSTDTKEPS